MSWMSALTTRPPNTHFLPSLFFYFWFFWHFDFVLAFGLAGFAFMASWFLGDILSFVVSLLLLALLYAKTAFIAIDVACLIAACVLLVVVRQKVPQVARSVWASVIVLLLVTNTLLSLRMHLVPSHIAVRTPSSASTALPEKKVGIALSGGGYRAALFHTGVLDALDTLHIPITSIASVSGGSIAASARWSRLESSSFVDAVVRGDFNLVRRMLDIESVPGLAFIAPGAFRRRTQQHILDDTILGKRTLRQLDEHGPRLMFIATELGYGGAVGFLPNGMLFRTTVGGPDPIDLYDNVSDTYPLDELARAQLDWFPLDELERDWPRDERISTIVAASGAFPGAFEPLQHGEMTFVDGGVTDNSALTLMLDMDLLARFCPAADPDHIEDWRQDLIIASDASQAFGEVQTHDGQKVGGGLVGPTVRAIDTAFARVTPIPIYAEAEKSANTHHPAVVRISPQDLFGSIPPLGLKVREGNLLKLLGQIAARPTQEAERTLGLVVAVASAKPGPLPSMTSDMTRVTARVVASLDREMKPLGTPDFLATDWETAIVRALAEDSEAFSAAETLSAEYSSDSAYRIYRLGFLLTVLNSATLRTRMETEDSRTFVQPLANPNTPGTLCVAFRKRSH